MDCVGEPDEECLHAAKAARTSSAQASGARVSR
jgi:hypothetical protein